MADLGGFAGQAAPVARDLNKSGNDVSRLIQALGPFSTASTTALTTLGDALETGRPALIRTRPLIQDLGLVRRARAARSPKTSTNSRRASTTPAASSARWTSSSSR